MQKSPQVVKHVVKSIMFIAKTRDFKRFIEKIKEKGLSQKLIIKRMAQPFAMKFCYLGKM